MRLAIVLCTLLLPAFAGSAVAAQSSRLSATFWATVAVDSSGRVESVAMRADDMPDAIRVPLERDILRWQFEPARVGGQPASSVTHVHVNVVAEQQDGEDAYALRIASARNGPAFGEMTPPRYPPRALRSATGGEVVVLVDIAADGTVADAQLASSTAAPGSRSLHLPDLEKSALKAVRKWTFTPEQVAGQPVASQVKLPIRFCVGTSACMPFSEQQPSEPAGQQLIAEQPAVRLKTDVAGRTL